ncbi:MAG: sensor histidine kinase [Limnochordaceae bacterium]|nr:sensor histidine kinase [Limnochordaceae bacterium]
MLHLDMALQSGEEVPQGTRQALEKLREVGEATLDEVRRITYDLRPAALDDLSLAAAVVWFARSRLEPAGIAVDAVVDACPERRLPPAAETAVFRIAQEALTNVLRHSGARHVRVRLSCPEGQPLELVVEDDGRGFDLHEVLGRRDHPALGLAGMRERAELLGGTLSIATAPGKGTRLEVRIDPAVLARLPEDGPVTEGG